MERCQPTYDIRVNDGRVEVDVDTRRVVTGPPEAAAEEAPAEATPG
jgi:hypothetical protein